MNGSEASIATAGGEDVRSRSMRQFLETSKDVVADAAKYLSVTVIRHKGVSVMLTVT